MRADDVKLGFEERLIRTLRRIYGERGYIPFKMSKFEEYDLYMKNRDFLASENIISFTDTDGALLALKPDVTLSIIKNAKGAEGVKEKLYYSENVYRTAGGSRKFKEIMQMGLECIGDIDGFDVCEAVELAARSLEVISDEFVLDVSHMGLVGSLLDEAGLSPSLYSELVSYISAKNLHEAQRLLDGTGVPTDLKERILTLLSVRVPLKRATSTLAPLAITEGGRAALLELELLESVLRDSPLAENIYFDASVMNDMNYYNGIVFRGFISGVSDGVLSGGSYDKLMKRMGKSLSGLGFAIYLDVLADFFEEGESYDVDVLLLYDKKASLASVVRRVRELIADGYTVSAQRAVPEGVRYGRIERVEGIE